MAELKIHPIAALFPALTDDELRELADDIKAQGQMQPIVLTANGKTIVDGINRHKACKLAGRTPKTRCLPKSCDELDIIEFIIGANMRRRDLNVGQRAMLGLELAPALEEAAKERKRKNGGDKKSLKGKAKSKDRSRPRGRNRSGEAREQVAAKVKVGKTTVSRAKKVKQASPALAAAVTAGTISLADAHKQVRQAEATCAAIAENETPSKATTIVRTHDGREASYPLPKNKTKFNQTNDQVSWAAFTWNPVTGCLHNCLSGTTPVLMADGRVVEIQNLRTGDQIIGTKAEGSYRKLITTSVIAHWKTNTRAIKIELSDGRTLVCSGDHRWLSNRGWKYTTPCVGSRTGGRRGAGQRPFLTLNNSLMGFGQSIVEAVETDEYRKGYLSGLIRGDGHLAEHHNARTFRLAMIDEDALLRADRYLRQFGIVATKFEFSAAVGNRKSLNAIRTGTRWAFRQITQLISAQETPEFHRGFLAGLFDAEGSGTTAFRTSNSNPAILSTFERALQTFKFRYIYDVDKQSVNKIVRTIRITGGLAEQIRFFQTCNPAIRRKLNINNAAIKNDQDLRVVSIEDLGINIDMYDITTGTEDFIANGVVSHNCRYCYAREGAVMNRNLQPYYPLGFEPTFYDYRLEQPFNSKVPDEARTDPRFGRVFVTSMGDLFGKWVPDEWIEKVFAAARSNPEWEYLFLTKFPQRYVGLALPPTAWIGTTVDEQYRVKIAEEAFRNISGVRVKWLSLEPLLAPLEFSDLSMFDFVVIGSQSATEQPAPVGHVKEFAPPFEWVARLTAQAHEAGCKVYHKPNLLGVIDTQHAGMKLIQEVPDLPPLPRAQMELFEAAE
jgi:protein gp37/ParB-like chromosome segregation protein Spo0J